MINYSYQFEQWLKSERKKGQKRPKPYPQKGFIGSRGYFHFDKTISIYNPAQINRLKQKLTSKETLSHWPFFPFIRQDQRNKRIRYKKINSIQPLALELETYIKSRKIMYASHQDACLFSFINYILEKSYEKELRERGIENNIIAYRSLGKGNVQLSKQTFDFSKEQEEFVCLLLDIKGFFDNIPHVYLENRITDILGFKIDSSLKHVLNNITHYRYVIQDEVIKELIKRKKPYFMHQNKKGRCFCKLEDFNKCINNKKFVRNNNKKFGIPQGSPMSGLLANICLVDFDSFVVTQFKGLNPFFYQRYSDDILIICPNKDAKKIYNDLKKKLSEIGLTLSSEKTEIFKVAQGKVSNITKQFEPSSKSKRESIQYLGLEWNGRQIILRSSTISRRFKPKNKLRRIYWQYNKFAIKMIGETGIQKQFQHIRKTIKKLK